MVVEQDEHLDDVERGIGNRKNRCAPKRLKAADTTIHFETAATSPLHLIPRLSKTADNAC